MRFKTVSRSDGAHRKGKMHAKALESISDFPRGRKMDAVILADSQKSPRIIKLIKVINFAAF